MNTNPAIAAPAKDRVIEIDRALFEHFVDIVCTQIPDPLAEALIAADVPREQITAFLIGRASWEGLTPANVKGHFAAEFFGEFYDHGDVIYNGIGDDELSPRKWKRAMRKWIRLRGLFADSDWYEFLDQLATPMVTVETFEAIYVFKPARELWSQSVIRRSR